jgi:AcrR family transcriptional regulator
MDMATGRLRGGTGAAGERTRARILDATVETIKQRGILGASARAIAEVGGFNQALLFYHFGSVEEALLAALDKLSAQRLASYEERLGSVRSLPELVEVGSQLYAEDLRDGQITVLAQLLAGSASSPAFGRQLQERFRPWIELTRDAIARTIAGTPWQDVIPVDDAAFAVAAVFMGIELLSHLGDEHARGQAALQTIQQMATAMQSLLGPQPPPPPA